MRSTFGWVQLLVGWLPQVKGRSSLGAADGRRSQSKCLKPVRPRPKVGSCQARTARFGGVACFLRVPECDSMLEMDSERRGGSILVQRRPPEPAKFADDQGDEIVRRWKPTPCWCRGLACLRTILTVTCLGFIWRMVPWCAAIVCVGREDSEKDSPGQKKKERAGALPL
jgi:hypothetical protein